MTAENKAWWRERVVYQIYPRSFQDSNGDGIGDLPGITKRLAELAGLGIGVIWLSPVYASPNVDNGYDISDYYAVNPEYGTLVDLKCLIQEAARLDIKIIMDLVINHTSDRHEWFIQSRDPQSPFRDYYIWRPGRDGGPPNNWSGFFGGSCWTMDGRSGEYYLHLFAPAQPDLNYRNPAVLEEVKAVMRFWLDLGISGFRCDVINILHKESLADGKPGLILRGQEHYLTREGTHEILRRLRREVLDDFDCFTVGETVFVTLQDARGLCAPERRELDMVFSFEHMETDQYFVKWFKRRFNPARFGRVLARWQSGLEWNANYLENHDQPRSVSRFGDARSFHKESAKLLAVLLLALRGTPFIYQGQEIGMTNFDFAGMEQVRDVESINIDRLARHLHFPARLRWRMIRATSRDNARTPMQWSGAPGAGFTAGAPWLRINDNYRTINWADQNDDPDSILNFYRLLIRLRSENEILKKGSFRLLCAGRLLAFERLLDGQTLAVLLNFGRCRRKIGRWRRADDRLLLSNYGGRTVPIQLEPYEAVILKRGEGSV